MTPVDARRAAERKLGNRTLVREEIYHMNTIHLAAAPGGMCATARGSFD
jgi:hypothetical protein